MDYTTLNTYLQDLVQDQTPSADYTTILPAAIQDAEERIYQDLQFLATRTANSNARFTAGARSFTLPTSPSTILTLQGVAAITPASATTPALGKRIQLEEASLDFIDSTWPTESETDVPDSWAMFNEASIVVKPTPAQSYLVELTGTFRPNPISVSNPTTYVSITYPNLLLNGCMAFLLGWQRDFGAQGAIANGAAATTWEGKYQDSLRLARGEEAIRQGAGIGWAPFAPTIAAPART